MKVGLSTVSTDGALKAISEENPDWDFDAVRTENQTAWNKLLSRVEAEGPEEDKTNFYTSLYHLFIQPTILPIPMASIAGGWMIRSVRLRITSITQPFHYGIPIVHPILSTPY